MTPEETKNRKEALYGVFLESWRRSMNFWDMARRKALDIPVGDSEMGDIQVTHNYPSSSLPAILGLLAGGGLVGTLGTALLATTGLFSSQPSPPPTQQPPAAVQQSPAPAQQQKETKIIIEWEGTPPRMIVPPQSQTGK